METVTILSSTIYCSPVRMIRTPLYFTLHCLLHFTDFIVQLPLPTRRADDSYTYASKGTVFSQESSPSPGRSRVYGTRLLPPPLDHRGGKQLAFFGRIHSDQSCIYRHRAFGCSILGPVSLALNIVGGNQSALLDARFVLFLLPPTLQLPLAVRVELQHQQPIRGPAAPPWGCCFRKAHANEHHGACGCGSPHCGGGIGGAADKRGVAGAAQDKAHVGPRDGHGGAEPLPGDAGHDRAVDR